MDCTHFEPKTNASVSGVSLIRGFGIPGQTQNRSTNGHKHILVSDFAPSEMSFISCLSFRSEHLKPLHCFLPLYNSCIPFWKPACIFCWNASVLHSSWRQSISKAQLPVSAGRLPFDFMWRALRAKQSISRVVEERTQSERCFVWRTL